MTMLMKNSELLKCPRNDKEYYVATNDGVQVEVFPTYIPERSDPESDKYFFACKMVITNSNSFGCIVLNRFWKIKDGEGKNYSGLGHGVHGEYPMIEPGETYSYISIFTLHTQYGNMRGQYQMEDQFGNQFWVDIPLFFFRTPDTFE